MQLEGCGEKASLRAVRAFARRRGIEEALADEVFEYELKLLDQGAKVRRYVPVRAEKHTRDLLETLTS